MKLTITKLLEQASSRKLYEILNINIDEESGCSVRCHDSNGVIYILPIEKDNIPNLFEGEAKKRGRRPKKNT